MRNFYNTSLVVLTSIVSMSVYCGDRKNNNEKLCTARIQKFELNFSPDDACREEELRALERHTEAIRHDPKPESVTSALSFQVGTNKEQDKKRRVQLANNLGFNEEDSRALAEEDYISSVRNLLGDIMAGTKRKCKEGIEHCDAVIASIKGDINHDEEWELFLPMYKHRPRNKFTALERCKEQDLDISADSQRKDIIAAYMQKSATYHDFVSQYARDSRLVNSVFGLAAKLEFVDDFEEENTQEIFKKYTELNQAVDEVVLCLQEEEALMNELCKKNDFVAAMIKKHKITLSAPFKNSDFE